MKRLMIFLLGVLLTTFSLPAVYACSGGYLPPLGELLEEATLVVKARVLDTDTLGQTGTIEVIDYLYGTSENNLLLLVQSDPVRTTALVEDRHGSGGCSITAPPLMLNEEAYFFLARNPDGGYRPSQSPNHFNYQNLVYRFPKPDSIATIGSGQRDTTDIPDTLTYRDVNETEFRAAIYDFIHSVPVASPANTGTYPMPAPVLVATASGETYILPVDDTAPKRLSDEEVRTLRRGDSIGRNHNPLGVSGCNTVGCTAYSPNGMDSATVTADGIVINDQTLPGIGFLFSPTNEAIVIWTETSLDFYTFRYPKLGLEQYSSTFFARYALNPGNQWVAQAAWSPDGRLLAYTDTSGLWLLDVYSQTPRLLIPVDATIPVARHFSPGGRYLAVTRGETRNTLDLVTGAALPDGVMSPNERFLIAYDTTALASAQSLCNVASNAPCRDLGLGTTPYWINDSQYLLMECTGDACSLGLRSINCCGGFYMNEVVSYDFEPVTKTYLTLNRSHELEIFDGYHFITQKLDEWIEDEIVSVEWLPALYYQSRTFSPLVVERYHEWLASLPPV